MDVILQDVNIASRHRNQNNSSLYMFHSFLIMRYLFLKIYSLNRLEEIFENELNFLDALINYAMYWRVGVWTHWTDEICLALRKVSTKFVSFQFSICQAWAHWDSKTFVLTRSVNHAEINTIACALFARMVAYVLRSRGLMVIFNLFDRIFYLGTSLLVF